jgi:TFIIF-interacting CTD phosphatase-like protein
MTQNKPKILLDLDATIISAEADEEFDFKKSKKKAEKFKYHDMDSYYIVFERPGLQEFLDFLFENFTVGIWTAASKDYALFIIEKIILAGKKNRHIDWIFFSYHCDISKRLKSGTKDLRILWEEYQIPGYNKDNTVILDDYDEVYKTQLENCIIAAPFEFTDKGSEKDDFLKRLQPLLTKFKDANSAKLVTSINKAVKTK